MNHILLEVFCTKDALGNSLHPLPNFCNQKNILDKKPSYNCLVNHCQYCAFTSHENAFCYINEQSEAEEIIALGGEMTPKEVDITHVTEHWKRIALKKMDEAYNEYMETLVQLKQL